MAPVQLPPDGAQVYYLGSSADLGALRRSLEARGLVTRSRLAPGVVAMVVDRTVPANHPQMAKARQYAIEVLDIQRVVDALLGDGDLTGFTLTRPRGGRLGRHRRAIGDEERAPLVTTIAVVIATLLVMAGVVSAMSQQRRQAVPVDTVSVPVSQDVLSR